MRENCIPVNSAFSFTDMNRHVGTSERTGEEMKKEVMDELIADTTLEDVGESCRPLVELIGLENVLKLSTYSMGDKIYFPKVDRLIAPARNRRIRKEYNGFNIKELAQAYDLTTNQIMNIVKEIDPQQITLFDYEGFEKT